MTHRTPSRGRARSPKGARHFSAKVPGTFQERARHVDDVNMRAAALLFDMAGLQGTERAAFGYKRAAKAVVTLAVPVSDLVTAGSLRDVQFIGPSSARVITELVEQGRSPSVEKALASATPSKAKEVETKRRLQRGFLSHSAMLQAHALPLDPRIVGKADFRGDFQMHTTWSDGTERVATMAEACLALGHTCLGVTDHSYGLPVARGMSMANAARQRKEIDALNGEYAGRFRIFRGIEANILADGSLDLQPAERREFEYVVASPHSLLRRPDDQTARMLGAVRQQGTTILGHPSGRMFNTRPGVLADWPRVFAEAAQRGVAIEIDGNWYRQDLDYETIAPAVEEGCLFALDSDAHSIGELGFTDYSIAHARLAGIPRERVINTWSDEALAAWMDERRR